MNIEKVIKSETINGQNFKLVSYIEKGVSFSGLYRTKQRSYMILVEGSNLKAYRVYSYSCILSFTNKTKASKAFNRIKKGEFNNREWVNTDIFWTLRG